MKKSKIQYSKKGTHRVRLSMKKRRRLEKILGQAYKNLNDEDLVFVYNQKRKDREIKKISFLSKTQIEKREM